MISKLCYNIFREKEAKQMKNFTSEELKVISNALEFYRYEMNKTEDMGEYRAWKGLMDRMYSQLKVNRGKYTMKGLDNYE